MKYGRPLISRISNLTFPDAMQMFLGLLGLLIFLGLVGQTIANPTPFHFPALVCLTGSAIWFLALKLTQRQEGVSRVVDEHGNLIAKQEQPQRRHKVGRVLVWLIPLITVPLSTLVLLYSLATSYRNLETEIEVSARQGWQSTEFEVREGELIHIEVIRGTWTYAIGVATPPHDRGEGSNYTCADVEPDEDCDEPIADAPAGALLGRIGLSGEYFLIGNRYTDYVSESGILCLRINDDDAGLDDNSGSLIVRITIRHSIMSLQPPSTPKSCIS